MSPRAVLALGLLLLVPQWARAASPESESRLPVLEGVTVSEYHSPTYGHGLELSFKQLGPEPALARFTVEDARAFVEALETAFQTSMLMGVSANTAASAVASAVASARTTGACLDASDKGDAKAHHIATNKNDISDASGGPWTPRFELLFARAAMDLNDPANIVYLVAHQGPHPQEYHQRIHRRLEVALGMCRDRAECRVKLIEELDRIAEDICKPGSTLNKLITKKP